MEIPGAISAGNDSAKETAIVLLMLNLGLSVNPPAVAFYYLYAFILGWLIWKTGRSAWLGWSRLERLHRILEQEKWEIEHNREQERGELRLLYAAKGFEGKLLEDVVDVMMADGDRLLKIMIEEEYGLSLEVHEHPLLQGLGACLGALLASLIMLFLQTLLPEYGFYAGAFVVITVSGYLSASFEGNRAISAIVWNAAIAFLGVGSAKFLLDYLLEKGLQI